MYSQINVMSAPKCAAQLTRRADSIESNMKSTSFNRDFGTVSLRSPLSKTFKPANNKSISLKIYFVHLFLLHMLKLEWKKTEKLKGSLRNIFYGTHFFEVLIFFLTVSLDLF